MFKDPKESKNDGVVFKTWHYTTCDILWFTSTCLARVVILHSLCHPLARPPQPWTSRKYVKWRGKKSHLLFILQTNLNGLKIQWYPLLRQGIPFSDMVSPSQTWYPLLRQGIPWYPLPRPGILLSWWFSVETGIPQFWRGYPTVGGIPRDTWFLCHIVGVLHLHVN